LAVQDKSTAGPGSGVGEAGAVGALADHGVRHVDMPATDAAVWSVLRWGEAVGLDGPP